MPQVLKLAWQASVINIHIHMSGPVTHLLLIPKTLATTVCTLATNRSCYYVTVTLASLLAPLLAPYALLSMLSPSGIQKRPSSNPSRRSLVHMIQAIHTKASGM